LVEADWERPDPEEEDHRGEFQGKSLANYPRIKSYIVNIVRSNWMTPNSRPRPYFVSGTWQECRHLFTIRLGASNFRIRRFHN
jgi:hypothetical protein